MTEIAGHEVGIDRGEWLCLCCGMQMLVWTEGGAAPASCERCGDVDHIMADLSASKEKTVVLTEDELRLLVSWANAHWQHVRSWDSGPGPVPTIADRIEKQTGFKTMWSARWHRLWEKRTW